MTLSVVSSCPSDFCLLCGELRADSPQSFPRASLPPLLDPLSPPPLALQSPRLSAAEVLQGSYGPKCDMWSMGVIAYMMVSGAPPFWGNGDAQVGAVVRLLKCWLSDYEHRIDALRCPPRRVVAFSPPPPR